MAAYGRLCPLFYDADKPRAPAAEVEWYAQRLPRDAGPVLEAMAGSGRLLLPLAERGVKLHGVDSSEPMLASCEARLIGAGLAVPLFRQDVAALNLPFRYAAAFIAAGSFQLLVDPIVATKALERLRAHLVTPGLLFLDCFVPAEALHPPGAPVVEVRGVTLSDATKIALRSETFVDAEGRRIDTKSRYERRDGATILAREDETLAITWYTEEELVALVSAAGYGDVAVEASPIEATGERRFAVRARA
ncbi:MAG: class I SAM-dependent methyltransferase [Betaproteobacteria bacterium]